jgi:glycosyltransferase involved in cell wall biosynthesis
MESYELTILMPCLNEAETLDLCIQKAKSFLTNSNIKGEILIADNGSTDGSQAIAQSHGAQVISIPTKGYGAALKGGIQAARGQYIVMGDADDSYDFLNIMPFLTKLREGYELVMGNRFKGGICKGAMPFLNRFLGNPVLSFIGRLFFKSDIRDFHCGLRGFHRETFKNLDLQGDGMEFASEMVIKASLNKLKITEVPIQLFPDGRSRSPHLRPWRDGWRHLRLLLLFSPRWLFYYPGLLLVTFGTLLMCLLFKGPLVLGHTTLDIHTMLFSSVFITVGLQAIFFSVFAHRIQSLYFNIQTKPPLAIVRYFTLERGLGVGLLLLLIGSSCSITSFSYWANHAFGNLAPTDMMRLLIPATMFLVLGMQFIFSSFFMRLIEEYHKK